MRPRSKFLTGEMTKPTGGNMKNFPGRTPDKHTVLNKQQHTHTYIYIYVCVCVYNGDIYVCCIYIYIHICFEGLEQTEV